MARGSISYHVKGPVVEGKTAPSVAAMIKDVDLAVAKATRDRWYDILKSRVRKWTGAFGRSMKVTPTAKRVTVGSSLPHGKWLEGTSRRNKVSRFKGYRALQQARRDMETQGRRVAEQVVSEHVRKDLS